MVNNQTSGHPLVFTKLSNSTLSGYDNAFVKIGIDTFATTTTTTGSTVIPDNYAIVSVSGVPTW